MSIIRLPDAPPWTEMELLGYEKEALGLYLSGHPIDRHADDLRAVRRAHGRRPDAGASCRRPPTASPGRALIEDVHVGGIVSRLPRRSRPRRATRCASSRSRTTRARWRWWCSRRPTPASAPPDENGALLLVRGKFERDEESSRLQATEVLPLAQLRERLSRGVRIRLKADTPA